MVQRILGIRQGISMSTHKVESRPPSGVTWPAFTFPALNLWNMPLHNEIVMKLNQYYYEHYKHLWEEDLKDE